MRIDSINCLPALLLFCGFFGSAHVYAQEIFKWVDEEGITHFSEQPPEVALASLEILEVVSRPATPSPAGDIRTTLEVANDMQAGRLERERLRLEKQKLEQQNRQARLDAMRYDEAYRSAYYYGPYWGYPRHRRSYGHHRGYPKQPYAGHRPPHGQYQGGGGSVPRRVFNR